VILRNLILIGALAALIPGGAAAQHLQLRPSASVLFRPGEVVARADTLHLPKTYWKEGALITGIPSAVFGGALAYGFCGYDSGGGKENCLPGVIGAAAFFGVIGAIPGAMIGALFDKPE
jgi:hypothetical protein